MIIHQPVKNSTPAAMEAIVLRFSPQSMHSEHLKPSRNPDIFFRSVQPRRAVVPEPGVAPRAAASLHRFQPRKQNVHGLQTPGCSSTTPAANPRMRTRGGGRDAGSGGSHAHHANASAQARALAGGAFRSSGITAGRRKC